MNFISTAHLFWIALHKLNKRNWTGRASHVTVLASVDELGKDAHTRGRYSKSFTSLAVLVIFLHITRREVEKTII